ncbi:LpxI family protein [Puniceicoccus vermicola]|uniref:UDP-2,3-diacylglucosamine diphosphatase LpxI n=1 Tax=Puniceicoccus vermicola TaxID=388746 RepID=A0A7X1AXU7_9BACT|nr:UDP-2,3-diacylglucosamine diphosphatase LpxI [Puniceicoccus vermicola]MBC2601991.1 UDP-2,3-diacylglucosamine diphosphatase LpxI [Puniceicoccus vermicola]
MSILSRFLPNPFIEGAPITLISGRGSYPRLTAKRIREAGLDLNLIALKGETPEDVWEDFPDEKRRLVKIGQIGRLVKSLHKFKTRYVVMVGQIQPRRLFGDIQPDLRAIKILASLKEKNAATIFGAIVNEIEGAGCTVLDARAFIDQDLADAGKMTKIKQSCDSEHLAHGIHIARESARLHIGQGVLVRKGTVLAVEAFEGTDDMLKRGGGFKTDQKIFVKIPHPDHDFRFDVPVFGIRTLKTMIESGITTAALATDQTVILDKEAVLQEATKAGVEILGFNPGTENIL